MKKFFAWLLRLCCFAVIGAAAFTLVQCLIHVNDDHSAAAIMGAAPVPDLSQVTSTMNPVMPSELLLEMDAGANENPTVSLRADGTATANHPTVTVTASFGNIVNSILADLYWYVDGELVNESSQCLLVEGSVVTFDARVDVKTMETEQAAVELYVDFAGKRAVSDTTIPVERPGENDSVVIQTEEITVTCIQDCSIYTDSTLSVDTGEIMWEDETGLLLAYDTNSGGLSALKLQFPDGSEGWVSARRNQITDEDCTTDEDYTNQQKMEFVNSMNYDSNTEYLVWVSLYTQKINVFTGYKGHWELAQSFDCASGVNETPTTTGVFVYSILKDRWDLGKTYVEPVLIFNGGEAFTSRPFDVETDEVADKTMGKPASGGSVRMMEDDIAWMADNLPLNTMVVVY